MQHGESQALIPKRSEPHSCKSPEWGNLVKEYRLGNAFFCLCKCSIDLVLVFI